MARSRDHAILINPLRLFHWLVVSRLCTHCQPSTVHSSGTERYWAVRTSGEIIQFEIISNTQDWKFIARRLIAPADSVFQTLHLPQWQRERIQSPIGSIQFGLPLARLLPTGVCTVGHDANKDWQRWQSASHSILPIWGRHCFFARG